MKTTGRIKALENLYTAVSAYCKASQEAKAPIPDGYWNRVLIAWNEARQEVEKE